MKLENLERVMKAQFVWHRDPLKPMQTNELIEGSKDTARIVFVGIANMYGFYVADICQYLDIMHDSYVEKLTLFRDVYRDGYKGRHLSRDKARIYRKIRLVLNAIQSETKRNPYIKMEVYLDNDYQP
jgi:hypothetical protein